MQVAISSLQQVQQEPRHRLVDRLQLSVQLLVLQVALAQVTLFTPDIDQKLYKFKSDDTPMMQIMLHSKRVNVKSPVVRHYIIDEPKSFVTTKDAVAKSTDNQFILPLLSQDQKLPRPYTTLLVKVLMVTMQQVRKLLQVKT